MADLIVSLVPLAVGIIMSPLAIMALVAVLLSHRARVNGIFFLLGWSIAVVVVLAVSFLVLGALQVHERSDPPLWVPVLRLVLGVVLLSAGIRVYRHGRVRAEAMARAATPTQVSQAAPQLPGWLRAVERFTPVRSGALGLGIFLLNPVDASCAAIAALDVRTAAVGATSQTVILVVFAVVAIAPIAIPVMLVLARGQAASGSLQAARSWIASHTHVLNAAVLLVIAVLQIQKAVTALLAL